MRILLLVSIIIFLVKCQIPSDQAINTCGKIGNDVPTHRTHCEDDKKGVNCCFVSVTNSTDGYVMRYCAIIPGKLNSNVKEEVKSVLGASDVVIECNKANYNSLYLSVLFIFVLIV